MNTAEIRNLLYAAIDEVDAIAMRHTNVMTCDAREAIGRVLLALEEAPVAPILADGEFMLPCGDCGTVALRLSTPRRHLCTDCHMAELERNEIRNAAIRRGEVVSVPEAAPLPDVVRCERAAPVARQCAHFKLMRRFYAIAKSAGLDTSSRAKNAMLDAFNCYLGTAYTSRGQLTADQWARVGDAVERFKLSWKVPSQSTLEVTR